jgi:hypothetical protein
VGAGSHRHNIIGATNGNNAGGSFSDVRAPSQYQSPHANECI